MKKKLNLFCFGFGQVAKSFIQEASKKYDLSIFSTNTKKTEIKYFKNFQCKSYFLKNEIYDDNMLKSLLLSDLILVSIPPINGKDIVVNNFKKTLLEKKPRWITYLSATSVYGNKNGEWVDENSELNPTSTKGKARKNVEKNWIDLFKENQLPIQIFRLSGIYSNESNVFKRLKEKNVNIIDKKKQFFSRIHVEDIANILCLSIEKFKAGEIYNISDDCPCSYQEVVEYASKLMGIPNPKTIKFEEVENEMMKNFYKDSKKVNNKKLKNFFSYNLKFPTYKEGLRTIFDNFV